MVIKKEESTKKALDDILRDLRREYTPEKFIISMLCLTNYAIQRFSESGINFSEMYLTLNKVPNSLYIIESIYYGIDDPNKIMSTYNLNPTDLHNFLREVEKLGLISYERRKIKITEKGKEFYETLIEFVKYLSDLMKIFKNNVCVCETGENKERESIGLDLSEPSVRQWYEYLKKKFEEEKSS